MIIDALLNIHFYLPIHPLFSVVAEFIATHDLVAMEPGKDAIGRGITISINEYATKSPETKKAEYHQKYIDIQVLLSGIETFGYCNRTLSNDSIPYDDGTDVGFATADLDFCKFPAGFFTVFFPHDLHMPGVFAGHSAGMVKKAVFKVPL
jgi:YhcH/YjgK/YiaL family protein